MKNYTSTLLVISLLVIIPVTSLAQDDDQSDNAVRTQVVSKFCTLLEQHYVFADKGVIFADFLREQLKKGAYDGLLEDSLAQALTRDVRSFGDAHMEVLHNPEVAQAILNPAETERDEEEYQQYIKRRQEKRRRNNYGFHKVANLEGNIGYLDLRNFDSSDQALVVANGAMSFLAHSDAVIIDLRKNTGGGITMFQLLASYFFESEPVNLGGVFFRESDELMTTYTLEEIEGKRMTDVDMFILTGEATFSAAEAFAYTMKHMNRAEIVGINTQGGAHMCNRYAIDEEYWAMISIAAAVNPVTNSNWEGVGVIPTMACPEEDALAVAHIQALKNLIKKSDDADRKADLAEIIESLESRDK